MIKLYCNYDANKVKILRNLGGRWSKKKKYWWFPHYIEQEIAKLNYGEVKKIFSNIAKPLQKCNIDELKTVPFKHQAVALMESLSYKGFALFCETGTGKTKMALDNFTLRHLNGLVESALVVCPLSGVGVWENEIEKHTNFSCTQLTGTKKQRYDNFGAFVRGYANIGIINYEGLLVLEKELKKTINENCMLILDESTWIKNPRKTKSNRTRIATDLAKRTKYRLILSGTPILNNILDIFSQWFIVDLGEALGVSWYKMREYFFNPDYMKFNWTPKPELFLYVEQMLENGSIRLLKSDCLDLPDKIYEQRYIYMEDKQKEIYESMVKNLITFFEEEPISASIVLTQMGKLQQIANGFIYNENLEAKRINYTKVNVVLELIEENPTSNIIIWCHFKEDSRMLYESIKEKGHKVFHMTSKNSKEVVEYFQNCPHATILVSNPKSCGYSITLTNADIVIYYSNSFDAGDRYQSEDRCHRIGLKSPVVYIDLITKDTIEENIYESLTQKHDLMKEILDIRSFLKGG